MWNSTGHGTYRERKEDSFFKILNITGYKNAVVTDTISAFTFVPLVQILNYPVQNASAIY